MANPSRNSVLTLQGFGIAFGERVILSAVSMDVPDRGVLVLLGPGGTGKSTLLRTIAGFNSANPSLRTWGQAQFAGAPLGDGERPMLVSQSARLMISTVFENLVHDLPERDTLTHMQQRDLAQRLLERAGLESLVDRLDDRVVKLPLAVQRHLAVLRLTAASPRLVCIDEPTTGLDPDECEPLLQFIREESTRRTMLVVLHNQQQARALGGHTALLAGGVIQEFAPSEKFFDSPESPAAAEFVRNGNCTVPSPNAQAEDLDEQTDTPAPLPAAATSYVSDSFGPRGFLWLKKGMLAGTPQPGIFFDLDYDLEALRRVGVTVLVTLTETEMDTGALSRYDIRSLWSAIPDMAAPPVDQAISLCEQINDCLRQGEVVAVHCRAGLGRTGTVLAAYLVWEGNSAMDALELVRKVEPRWVQSEEQVNFLEEFAVTVANGVPQKNGGASKTNAEPIAPTGTLSNPV
jgi:atypical dual specificity phosphatase